MKKNQPCVLKTRDLWGASKLQPRENPGPPPAWKQPLSTVYVFPVGAFAQQQQNPEFAMETIWLAKAKICTNWPLKTLPNLAQEACPIEISVIMEVFYIFMLES